MCRRAEGDALAGQRASRRSPVVSRSVTRSLRVESLTLSYVTQWTAVTRDGKASAQFEETLLITETGVEVLTAAPGWVLPAKKAADGSAGVSASTAGAGVEKAAEGDRAPGEGSAKKKKKKAKK